MKSSTNQTHQRILLVISLMLFLAAVFSCSVYLNFSRPDDSWMLINNRLVPNIGFDLQYYKEVFTTFNDIQYSPLNTIYYSLIYKLSNFNPYYYHLFSFIIHCINTVSLWCFLKKLLPYLNIEDNGNIISLLSVLIWSIHPANVEAIVWISASKILLSTFFLLISFNFLITARNAKRSVSWLAIIFYICACLSKEQSIVLLPIIFTLDLNKHGTKGAPHVLLKRSLEYTLIAIITAVFIVITSLANGDSIFRLNYSLFERVLLASYSIFFYLFTLIIPYNLHYHYPFPILPGEQISPSYYLFLVLIFLSIIYIFKEAIYKEKGFVLFIAGMIPLSICLHILPMYRTSMLADRYLYLPGIFLIPLIVHTFSKLMKKLELKQKPFIVIVLVLVVLAIYSTYSYFLAANWHTLNITKN